MVWLAWASSETRSTSPRWYDIYQPLYFKHYMNIHKISIFKTKLIKTRSCLVHHQSPARTQRASEVTLLAPVKRQELSGEDVEGGFSRFWYNRKKDGVRCVTNSYARCHLTLLHTSDLRYVFTRIFFIIFDCCMPCHRQFISILNFLFSDFGRIPHAAICFTTRRRIVFLFSNFLNFNSLYFTNYWTNTIDMFVLIWMHSSKLFQIWSPNFKIVTFFKHFCGIFGNCRLLTPFAC